MPNPAPQLAARPSSVDACTAADLGWRSAAGTLLSHPSLLQLASIPQAHPASRVWSGNLHFHAWNCCFDCDGAAVADALAVGEEIGKADDGGGVAVAVAVVAAGAVTAAAAAAAAVAVAAGVAAAADDGWRDCTEEGEIAGRRGEIVEVVGVVADDPTSEAVEDNRTGMFVDRGLKKKRGWRGGVAADQDA